MTKTQKFLSQTALSAAAAPFVLGAMLMAAPAQAQDTAAAEDGELIVVTGSRIARRDLSSSSPIAVVSDEEFKLSGAVNVEQVLNVLPQVIPGTTSFSNNPGGGVATLNLRGLGSNRNLVLVNGRRWMFYDTTQIVDLNTIPQFLIESVDVVTGGASAVYGSDALAGVVNFQLRKDLNGFEAGSQYSITEAGDGGRFDVNIAMGTEFADGRGHITAFASYYKRKPIFQDARDFSRFSFGDGAGGVLVPGGSSSVPQGRFVIPGTVAVGGVTYDLAAGTQYTNAFFASPGVSRPYVAATDAFNYAPDNYLQVPQERWLVGAYGEYEISDAVTAYFETAFVNNRVANELAPTPFGITTPVNIDAAIANGYLSAADAATLRTIDAREEIIRNAQIAAGVPAASLRPGLGTVLINVNRRINETGSRASLDERNAFRVLFGAKGDITEKFSWDAYYSYARTRNANVQDGNISRSALTAGLLDGSLNLFGLGTLTPSMVDQIAIRAQNNDISVLQVASASVNGSLFNFGWGGEDVGIAVGVEYRSVQSRFIPDTALSSGDVLGFNAGDSTQGGYNVKEAFAELNIPIVADQPFFHLLELNAAGRYSDYSLTAVGSVWTYSGGIKWAPIQDITFRGNYQRAIRAPNVGELFGGTANGFPPATDPCSNRQPVAGQTATVRQLCIDTGVPAAAVFTAGVQPDDQIESQFGGNPNLIEEKSDSYTFGAVIRPSFIPRLNIAIDYFHVKIDQAIFTAGGGTDSILNLCYNVIQDANSAICGLINRDPTTGEIGDQFLVQAGNANLASLKTSGIDLSVDYSIPLGFGLLGEESKFDVSFLGTWTESNVFVPVAGLDEKIECAGLFGLTCGEPQASFKWTTRFSWVDGPLTSSLRWRHLSGVDDDAGPGSFIVDRIGSYDLFDLAFNYEVNDQLGVSFGVNNLLDKKPPILGSNQEQANTYPDTFDPLGRDFFVSARFRF